MASHIRIQATRPTLRQFIVDKHKTSNMSRFLAKQTLKSLRSHIHRPLPHYPSLFSTYHHQEKTYNVVAKAMASYPEHLNKIADKKRQQARHEELIDIHDFDAIRPQEYNIRLTDVDDGKLGSEIAEALGIHYLGGATAGDAGMKTEYIDGYLYGHRRRPVLPCVVRNGDQACWVIFIVVTGAPATYISPRVIDALNLRTDGPTSAHIAGYKHPVQTSPSNSGFAGINIIGADFLDGYQVSTCFLGSGKVRYLFEGRREL